MPIPEITRGSPEWLHVPRQGVACCGKDDDGPSHDKHNLLDGVRPLAHQLCAWRLMMEKSKENLRMCLVWLVAYCAIAPCIPLHGDYVKRSRSHSSNIVPHTLQEKTERHRVTDLLTCIFFTGIFGSWIKQWEQGLTYMYTWRRL